MSASSEPGTLLNNITKLRGKLSERKRAYEKVHVDSLKLEQIEVDRLETEFKRRRQELQNKLVKASNETGRVFSNSTKIDNHLKFLKLLLCMIHEFGDESLDHSFLLDIQGTSLSDEHHDTLKKIGLIQVDATIQLTLCSEEDCYFEEWNVKSAKLGSTDNKIGTINLPIDQYITHFNGARVYYSGHVSTIEGLDWTWLMLNSSYSTDPVTRFAQKEGKCDVGLWKMEKKESTKFLVQLGEMIHTAQEAIASLQPIL